MRPPLGIPVWAWICALECSRMTEKYCYFFNNTCGIKLDHILDVSMHVYRIMKSDIWFR